MPPATTTPFEHVSYLWDDAKADGLDALQRLVYRSNLLGQDQRITNTGGGNTSSKAEEIDPLTGQHVEVLWVKGSGGDLRTATAANFSSLYQERLIAMQNIYNATEPRGVKTEIEDRMVGLYPHCTFNLNPRASSIDTPLHSFVPAPCVDHTHPNSVIAVAASKRSKELTAEIYGDRVGWVPWMRPGFELGLQLQEACRAHPEWVGIVLGQHGLINWTGDDKSCYELSLELIEEAARFIEARDRGDRTFGGRKHQTLPESKREAILFELLPWLRGQVSDEKRFIGTIQSDEAMLRFVNSVDAPRLAELGTSCPDHFLRTKIKPLYVPWDPAAEDVATLKQKITDGIEQYRKDYAAYYERHKHPDSPAMRNSSPTVILIPGIGMVAWGKSKSESRVTAEFYNCAVEVMRGAEAIDEYVALPAQEAFDIEYWLLEEAKLRRQPPEKELARQVVIVIGAGHGIGRAAAHRLAREGAHVVCADVDEAAARAVAAELTETLGVGIGVSGTGISGCGPAIGLAVDVTDRESVHDLIMQTVLAYGGLDSVVVTAGVYVPPDAEGRITDEQWKKTFDVNVMGAWVVADEAASLWAEQGLPGTVVITTSVNAIVPKTGSLAYDASKAAANHLVRELAMQLAPNIRVNGLAPATVVGGSSMFPRDRVLGSLQKYAIEYADDEDTETLRERLAQFYAQRTLLGEPITCEDQAETIFFLVSDRAAKTTGQILSVDGGLPEAFVR